MGNDCALVVADRFILATRDLIWSLEKKVKSE